MKAEEIKDEASLRAWLDARPEATRRSDAIAIATRAALRVFPLWSGAMDAAWARKGELTALPILRANLTSASRRGHPTPDPAESAEAFAIAAIGAVALTDSYSARATARAAAFAATTDEGVRCAAVVDDTILAANDVSGLAHSDAKTFPAFARAVLREAVRVDAITLAAGQDPFTRPLWPSTPPDWFTEHDRKTREIWSRDPDTWSFWTRWWDGILSGQQIDRDLQHQVALIPDALWQEGPAAVAEAIREIEAELPPAAAETDPARGHEVKLGAIRLQAETLRLIVDAEWTAVRARNHVPESEQAAHGRRIELLSRLRDLIIELQSVASGVTEAAPGTELVVVNQKLPDIVGAAEDLAGATRQAQPSSDIISIAATTKMLIESGMPPHLASGVALTELVIRKFKAALASLRRKKGP